MKANGFPAVKKNEGEITKKSRGKKTVTSQKSEDNNPKEE